MSDLSVRQAAQAFADFSQMLRTELSTEAVGNP